MLVNESNGFFKQNQKMIIGKGGADELKETDRKRYLKI